MTQAIHTNLERVIVALAAAANAADAAWVVSSNLRQVDYSALSEEIRRLGPEGREALARLFQETFNLPDSRRSTELLIEKGLATILLGVTLTQPLIRMIYRRLHRKA